MSEKRSTPSASTLSQTQFVRLLLANERELMRYIMALVPNVDDARDIVQETAVDLWESIDQYDVSRPFIPWANRFALKCAQEFLRKERRRKRLVADDVAVLLEARRAKIASQLDLRREHLQDCLNRLPDDQRRLMHDYYFEDHKIDSLATRFGRSVDAIYKCLTRIRQTLQECINRKLREEL